MPEEGITRRRITIADIAQSAGVSKGSVSNAMNNRPGVSDLTRRRILSIANELGWYPNSAARALSVARANACGLVLARPTTTLASEPFFMELLAGIEAELSARSIALTIQVVQDVRAEVAVYRRWWAEHRVDGVFLVDLRTDDPRIDELVQLGLPALVVGGQLPGGEFPAVWHNEAAVLADIVRYLFALGHRRIARVAGVPDFVHTVTRTQAFLEITRTLSLPLPLVVTTDFMAESGAQATRQLLLEPVPPTAVVYDSDVLAVAGLGVAHEMGFVVPDDVSLVAWDDSPYCRLVHPPLTAVTRDIPAYGALASARLLELVEGAAPGDVESLRGKLTPRQSTGPAPRLTSVSEANEAPDARRPGPSFAGRRQGGTART